MTLESLLISRDASLLGVLRPTLESMSVSVQVCSAVQSGSELLCKQKFDAVIVDCDDLQGGVDLLKSLRATRSNASSVTFAVLNGATSTQQAFQLGANFVLQKPLTPLNATRCLNAALSFMVRERRRYFRHPVEMPVHISFAENAAVNCTASNVSEGGMAIRFSGALPNGADVRIQFTLPETKDPLEVRAKIAWADGAGNAGIRFMDVPQSTQIHIDKWLADRLVDEMPENLQGYVTLQ
jgi:CheY-like chemotaxis protein